MPKSNQTKSDMLNFLLRNQTVAQPTTIYLALFATDPTAAGTGTEVNYDGYQRQPVVFGVPTLVGDKSQVTNSGALSFAVVAAPSGNLTHAALFTELSGGTMLYYGSLAATYALSIGVQPIVPVGSLVVTES